MIVYSNDKLGFVRDIPDIEKILRQRIEEVLGEESSESEILSWRNSLACVGQVINHPFIPDDAGIALEYNIPLTNNRIDFMISGRDRKGRKSIVLIELKQWSAVKKTDKDAVVVTYYQKGLKETIHPSYQAVCYASLLYEFKEVIQKREIGLHPCAFLHNYKDDGILKDCFYKRYTDNAPVFCKGEELDLRSFIAEHIARGDQQESILTMERSRTIPSKSLMDSVVGMSEGKPEFRMIDDQKVVYSNILHAYESSRIEGKKFVVIVHGGPGTGKSVIGVKLLFEMIRHGKIAHYITKNAAPRNVFFKRLTDGKNIAVRSLFKSSGFYVNSRHNEFDMLIADEAHRLTERSDRSKKGENQVKEIINAAQTAVFFIDEKQHVSLEDIGSISEIEKWASYHNATVVHQKLGTQFRCAGSDEYMNWLEGLLQMEDVPVKMLSNDNYDFRVFDSPSEMMQALKEHNGNNKARMVAGYCWEWKSRGGTNIDDITIPGTDFSCKWNLANDNIWSISPHSIEQIGCIHTCQGLEFDYVGVIIGEDLVCRDGKILVDPSKRAKDDRTIHGYQEMMKSDPEKTKTLIRAIIKNTYRVLMTRGMKGCFVYIMDKELKQYIKNHLK